MWLCCCCWRARRKQYNGHIQFQKKSLVVTMPTLDSPVVHKAVSLQQPHPPYYYAASNADQVSQMITVTHQTSCDPYRVHLYHKQINHCCQGHEFTVNTSQPLCSLLLHTSPREKCLKVTHPLYITPYFMIFSCMC